MSVIAYVAIGFLLGLPLTWGALQVGRRVGLLDVPAGIKVHRLPVPYTGGAAIAASVILAGALFEVPPALLAGGLLMWLVGFADDFRGLPPLWKLLAEVVPLIVGASALGLEPPLLIAAVVVGLFLVNAFNVIDGLDGLAAGVALISILALLFGATAPVAATAGLLVGSIAAFLTFNLHPARLFLGDQGSLLLGYFLWILPLMNYMAYRDARALVFGALLWLFPLLNVGFVLTKRLSERRSLLVGDRNHLYDVLHGRFGLRATLLVCWSLAAVSSIAAAIVLGS